MFSIVQTYLYMCVVFYAQQELVYEKGKTPEWNHTPRTAKVDVYR